MSKSPCLIVIGTVAIDELSTPFGARQTVFGGSASYFSCARKLLLQRSASWLLSTGFPEEYRKVLADKGV